MTFLNTFGGNMKKSLIVYGIVILILCTIIIVNYDTYKTGVMVKKLCHNIQKLHPENKNINCVYEVKRSLTHLNSSEINQVRSPREKRKDLKRNL